MECESMNRAISMVVLGGLVAGLTACHVVDRERHTYVNGRALTSSEAATIRVGQTTSAELIQSFGAPTTRADRPDGTATWQWCATTTESSSGHVLLLWDRDSTKTATQCTTVELASGVVTAVSGR